MKPVSQRARPRILSPWAGAAVAGVLLSPAAWSFSFNLGDNYSGSLDTILSAGASLRVEEADSPPGSTGNANFDDGDLTSVPLKGVTDLGIKGNRHGAFFRVSYLYDPVIEDKDDNEIPKEAKSRAGHDIRLLDAFVYGSFDVGARSVEARLGSQVVSWGESTFISGGINTINPADIGRLLTPGVEVKEGLLPAPMIWLSVPMLFDYTGIEMYYKMEWDETELPPVGTYFSPTDLIGEGKVDMLATPLGTLPKSMDRLPDDGGEYGVRISQALPSFGYAELGFYYINYHAQSPIIAAEFVGAVPSFYLLYPEDIELFGVSANSQIGEWAVQGELSYRPDFPIANDTLAVLGSLAGGPTAVADPYQEFEYKQAQVTGTRVYSQWYGGMDRMTAVIEAGTAWLPDGVEGYDHIDNSAWGVQARFIGDYFDAMPGITVSPQLALEWDVNGTLGSAFSDNAKSATLSVDAKHVDVWSVSLGYTRYWAGGTYEDRDFVSMNYKHAF